MTPADLARLTTLRHALHRRPELSGHEAETAKHIAEILRGLQPDQLVEELGGHGVAAVFDSGWPGPSVGIRCELDGLPIPEETGLEYASEVAGHGHLCGHDGHMVTVLAVAEALARKRPEQGRAIVLFQPAEETGKGAAAVLEDPRYDVLAPDFLFALHNLPGLALGQVELCADATNCASRGMKVALRGRTSHAAAPQDGLSPAAAMTRLMPLLGDLGQGGALGDDYALTTLTHATLGEPTFGVAPGCADIWVTLRTVTDARMQRLVRDAERLAQKVARDHGLGVEFTYDDIFDACTNQRAAVTHLCAACQKAGVPLQMASQPQRFSEDFGRFAARSNTAMFWLGAGKDHPQLHNPDYDFPDALISIGSRIFLSAIHAITSRDGARPSSG